MDDEIYGTNIFRGGVEGGYRGRWYHAGGGSGDDETAEEFQCEGEPVMGGGGGGGGTAATDD